MKKFWKIGGALALTFSIISLSNFLSLKTDSDGKYFRLSTQSDVNMLARMVSTWSSMHGRIPTDLEGLRILDTQARLVDGWGRPLIYKNQNGKTLFFIYSAGPNGKDELGHGDDISSPPISAGKFQHACLGIKSLRLSDLFSTKLS